MGRPTGFAGSDRIADRLGMVGKPVTTGCLVAVFDVPKASLVERKGDGSPNLLGNIVYKISILTRLVRFASYVSTNIIYTMLFSTIDVCNDRMIILVFDRYPLASFNTIG